MSASSLPRLRRLVPAIAAAALTLTACTSVAEDGGAASDTSGTSGTSSENAGSTASGPRTLTDDAGVEVEVPTGEGTRVACLTAICGDALAELDVQPVAYRDQLIVDERFWGPDTDMVEVTGAFGEENLEDVAVAEPDVVIGLVGAHDALREGLEPIAPLYLVDPRSWQDSVEVLELMGEITGTAERAAELGAEFEQFMADSAQTADDAAAAAGGPATMMAMYGSPDSLAVDSAETPVGSALAELGEYPWTGAVTGGHSASVPVSVEEILDVDPDVVFVQTFSFGAVEAEPLSDQLAGNRIWSQLGAVAGDRVVEVDPELWGTGRGTRTLRLVVEEALAAAYPDA